MNGMIVIKHTWPHALRLPYDAKPRLIFADPSYNLGIKYDDDPTGDKLEPDKYELWSLETMYTLMEMLPPGGMLWWLTWAKHGRWTWRYAEAYGSLLHGAPIIWHERFSQYQSKRLTLDYRMLFPIVKPGANPVFNPDDIREESERQILGDKRADPRGRVPSHVWRVRRLQGTSKDHVSWHPAQLPPEPLERIVRGWTNKSDLVMDAFCGSGNMGIVCKKLNREFVGTDSSQSYVNRANFRIQIHGIKNN